MAPYLLSVHTWLFPVPWEHEIYSIHGPGLGGWRYTTGVLLTASCFEDLTEHAEDTFLSTQKLYTLYSRNCPEDHLYQETALSDPQKHIFHCNFIVIHIFFQCPQSFLKDRDTGIVGLYLSGPWSFTTGSRLTQLTYCEKIIGRTLSSGLFKKGGLLTLIVLKGQARHYSDHEVHVYRNSQSTQSKPQV